MNTADARRLEGSSDMRSHAEQTRDGMHVRANFNLGFSSLNRYPLMSSINMSDVTQILQAIEQGNPKAGAELLPLVYQELRRLAAYKMS